MHFIQDPNKCIKDSVQKFKIPGHSYLPNDTDFNRIENKIRKHQHICHPSEVQNIIKTFRIKKKNF